MVPSECSRLDPVKPKRVKAGVAHRPRGFGRVALAPMARYDPVAELGPPIDEGQVAELDHPGQIAGVAQGDGKGQGLPPSKLGALFLHEFDRVTSEIRMREEVQPPSRGRVSGRGVDGIYVTCFGKAQDQTVGPDRKGGPSASRKPRHGPHGERVARREIFLAPGRAAGDSSREATTGRRRASGTGEGSLPVSPRHSP